MEQRCYVEDKPLCAKITEVLSELHMTKQELGLRTGLSRTAISQYLNGKYQSDTSAIEKKLEQFLEKAYKSLGREASTASCESTAKTVDTRKDVYSSNDYVNTIGLCKACQEDMAVGLVVGRSGYGKTHTLKTYAKLPRVAYVECDDTMGCKDLVEDIEKALGIPSSYGTIHRRVKCISEFLNVNQGYLLIIDEADKLISKYTQKKMEILRFIMDQSEAGLVIAGEPRLESEIKTYLTRFGNRIDLYWKFKGLSRNEVVDYMSGYAVDDDALQEIIVRATNDKTGCFRLLDRTMKNVVRVMNESSETRITLKIIKQASGMMML